MLVFQINTVTLCPVFVESLVLIRFDWTYNPIDVPLNIKMKVGSWLYSFYLTNDCIAST